MIVKNALDLIVLFVIIAISLAVADSRSRNQPIGKKELQGREVNNENDALCCFFVRRKAGLPNLAKFIFGNTRNVSRR